MKVTVHSPSNIALVKYWGKVSGQIPMNASLSLTLKECITTMTIEILDDQKSGVQVFFHGEEKKSFLPKIEKLISKIRSDFSAIENSSFIIRSENSFPHSAGIASSASSMSALSFGIISLIKGEDRELASHYARLGSGSACRSLYSHFVTWGEHSELCDSHNHYASELPQASVHKKFITIYDSICIVSSKEKSVSSTAGHSLMDQHLFRETRINQAQTHISDLLKSLKIGDWARFGEIVESEALTLHGLMMNSSPSFILLEPQTLAVIAKVRDFRARTGAHLYFTLDAGPNVHLIYGDQEKGVIKKFIDDEISLLCENKLIIHDEMSSRGSYLEK